MDRIIEIKVGGNHISKDGKYAGVRGEANVTRLRITFDESWNGYAKKVTFWDARGANPVERTLTTDYLENIIASKKVYLVPIPAEPMAEAGMITFVIDGYLDGKRQRSMADKLEVKDAPIANNAGQPVDPTPSVVEQFQTQLEKIVEDIHEAVEAKEDIENMTATAETLHTGDPAFVEKSEKDGVVNLHFGLPAGGKGDRGISGVHLGSEEPTDPDINVWIDPEGYRIDSGVYIGSETPEDPDVNVWIDPEGKATDISGIGSLMTSVKSFGAVGDGVADDTAALMAAARSGQPVYFPAGVYLLFGQIDMTADINWCGEGKKSVIRLMPFEQSRPEEYGGRTVYNCYMLHHNDGANRYSVILRDLVLDANKSAYASDILNNGSSIYDHTTCIDLNKPLSVHLDNVECINGLIEGCYINSVAGTNITISNSRFSNNGEYQIDGSGLHIEGAADHTCITNCELSGNGFHGLLLGGAYGANVSNITCCHNGFGGVALWGGSSNNVLSGVYCKGNFYGIIFKSAYSAYHNDSYDNSWMVYATGNNVAGLTTVNNTYGVVFCNCANTLISGWNCIRDAYAYHIGYGGADKDITGCVFAMLDYVNGKASNNGETDKFKVKFIGG